MSNTENGNEDAIPTWLDDKFLENALRSAEGEPDLEVTSSDIRRATAPGDNYMSIMYRGIITVERRGQPEKKSLIIKTEHEGTEMRKLSRKSKVFELEAMMFKDVIPAMNDLLKAAGCIDFTPFGAKFIYAHFGAPCSVIVMEDLKSSGFELAERKAGLDLDHCRLVIKTLAKFHAASVVLSKKNPDLIEPFLEPPTKDVFNDDFGKFFNSFIEKLSIKMKSTDKLERFSERILNIAGTGMQRWTNGRIRNDEEFNVLIHGDLWVNNMMFRYNKGNHQVEDVRFVDYQLSYWSSPAVDLQYFLTSSPTLELIENQDIFVELYLETLADTLTKLGYDNLHPSMKKLKEQMKYREDFALMCVLSIRNAVLAEDENIMDPEKAMANEQEISFGNLFLNSLEKQLAMLERKVDYDSEVQHIKSERGQPLVVYLHFCYWLDEDFVEKLLRLSEDNKNLSVTSHELTRATAAGDNYASDMYRVKISFTKNGKKETKHLILKAVPGKEEMSKLLEQYNIFEREATVLSQIIPEMHDLLNKTSINNFKPFAAKCFYSQFKPSVIVMEDLKEKGFTLAERMQGLDMKHSLLVMKQIARYHASSAALYKKKPEVFEDVRESIFAKEGSRGTSDKFFGQNVRKLAAEVNEWPDYKERFGGKLNKIAENVIDTHIALNTKIDEDDFICYTHGDLWLNNMMFRFVDFQLGSVGSPTLDILYFLNTSVSLDFLDKHSTLIEEYHKTLAETLSLLDITSPKWLDDDFVEKLLRLSEDNKNLTVTSHELTRATAAGDNYASDMYRIKIFFTKNDKKETKQLILKAVPGKEEMSKPINNFKPFAAKCFYSQFKPSVIVMEDLKEKGFTLAERMQGLDMKHSLLVMKQIARYHASSAVLYENKPEVFEDIRESIFAQKGSRGNIDKFFGENLRKLAAEVNEWPDYKERFGEKLNKIAENVIDTHIALITKIDEDDFICYIHGDLWLNNMMFRFVDFQIGCVGNPTLDILYFLNTSVSLDLLDKHSALIEEYHKTLAETLSLLGYGHLTPSLTQLYQQMDKRSTYSIIVAGSILPFVLADKSNIPDIEKLLKENSEKIKTRIFQQDNSSISPKWLDEFFLEKILRLSENNKNLTVTSHELTRATAAGDNYASDMYRIKLSFTKNGKKETKQLILKAVPDKEEMSKCFHSQFKPSVIVMEDLKEKGFTLAERMQGLDMKHSLLVMKQIARYHAASVALMKKNPDIFKDVHESIYANKELIKNLYTLMGKGVKNLATEVKGWPEYKERFGGKLDKIAEQAVDTYVELNTKIDEEDFNCFTHGDLWLNNMMFRYSNSTGEVEEVRFVDFQIGCVGSPVLDVMYFLYTSVSLDFLDKHSTLIEEYHKTLAETLSLLGYDHLTPSLAQLYQQMDKRSTFCIIVVGSILSFVLADKSNIPDVEKMLKENSDVNFSESYKQAKMLRLSEDNKNLTVTSHELTRATAPGDNYTSDMFRIKISFTKKGKKETKSLILKAMLEKEEMSKVLEQYNIFEREATVLSKIVPEIHNLLNTVSKNKFKPFAAKCFYSQFKPSVIVMEDLKEKGFTLAERMQGLDMKHSLLVIKQIARYHAASAALLKKEPEVFKDVEESVFANEDLKKNLEPFFGKGVQNLANEVNGWPEYKERFGGKLEKIAEKAVDTYIEINSMFDKNDFNCYTHGDLWLNNMMFRYSNSTGEVEEVRFVDFQVGSVGSPVLDVLYFLHTSVSLDLLDKHTTLIEEYHKTLAETLSLLSYDHLTPSLAQLYQQMDKRSTYSIIVAGSILPFVLVDKSNIPDVEKMLKENSGVKFSESYKKAIYEESQLFQREAEALYKVVPEMYNVLNTVSTNQFKHFSPKCYYSQSHASIIVMEDLKEKGFKLAKRMLGLDMKHSLLVIKQIARYHAASVVLYETNPDVFEPLRDSIYKEKVRETLEIFYRIGMKAFASEVKRWPDYSERFGAKLHEIAERSVDLLIAAAERVDGDFNCFVHGDLWLNNMMFVDYQMCLLSSPALDLQYFLYTSVSIDLLDQHRILIEEYHKTLGQTLSLLGYKHLSPSLDQLQQQLDKAGTYAIIISSSILPFVFADESNIPNVEEMIKDEEGSGIFSEEFKNAMKLLLLDFERKKWL
ncbi:hypothetical protein C0J52_17000 [Blattella germanica]|nr:hypothetical protein C0J52_17000 [Blattella germanica]